MRPRTLVARLDSDGDVLLAGPAVRAVAAGSARVTLLVAPSGEQAARLLPGVDEVVVWPCPWTGFDPPPVDPGGMSWLVERVRRGRYDVAVVLTSDHQSPLPLAVLLRQAGVPRIVASSHDYPGSLLDVRHPPGGPHEVQRNLSLAAAAGFEAVAGSDALAVLPRLPPAPTPVDALPPGYVVVHPAASVPARSLSPHHAAGIVAALVANGRTVVVTGSSADRGPADAAMAALLRAGPGSPSGATVVDAVGRTTFAELATVLAGAACLVAGNTGPAHLAAAVGTPVACLFAPVVPATAWHPWGVPVVLLGEQDAPCAGTRARSCPVPGHPCLNGVAAEAVVEAVNRLVGPPAGGADAVVLAGAVR